MVSVFFEFKEISSIIGEIPEQDCGYIFLRK